MSEAYLPCGHPALCGSPCGWCLNISDWKYWQNESYRLRAEYSDALQARTAELNKLAEQFAVSRAECDRLKVELYDQKAGIRLVQDSCASGIETSEVGAARLRAALIDLVDASQDSRCADLRIVIKRSEATLNSTDAGKALLTELNAHREAAAWCYQLAGVMGMPEKVLDNLSALANHDLPPHEWTYPIDPTPFIESERLRVQLTEYGRHLWWCVASRHPESGFCNCGFASASAQAAVPSTEPQPAIAALPDPSPQGDSTDQSQKDSQ